MKENRRKFIKRAGTGTAALIATAPLLRTGLAKASPNDTINVAVMGIRSRGSDHAANFARLPNVNVAVLCDIDERLFPKALANVEEIAGRRPKTQTHIRKVLADKDIDVVSSAAPNH